MAMHLIKTIRELRLKTFALKKIRMENQGRDLDSLNRQRVVFERHSVNGHDECCSLSCLLCLCCKAAFSKALLQNNFFFVLDAICQIYALLHRNLQREARKAANLLFIEHSIYRGLEKENSWRKRAEKRHSSQELWFQSVTHKF